MRSLIARHVLFPLHETVLRRPTRRALRELEASQWMAPDELRDLQREKLRDLLIHADRHTPFYRERIQKTGADVRSADPLDVLDRLPLLTKDDIRTSGAGMLWADAPGGVFPYNTGGSSGEPLKFYLDRRRQAYDQAARIRAHRWFDADIGDREIYLWGSPVEIDRTGAMKRVRDTWLNQHLLNAFDMSPTRMDEYLDTIERYQPTCLFGYPSSLSLLAGHGRAQGRRLKLSKLRAVFVTGEVCFPHHREAIAAYFKAPIADEYGSRDAGFIAHQCPLGESHVTAENVIVEIVRNGQVVPSGEPGEIVVTHFDNYAMPFVRYRTGDMGRLKPGRCACGRGLPLMDVVQGRQTDFIYLPDGTIKHALSVIYPLRALSDVRQFRVTQHPDYDVTVDIVGANKESCATREAVLSGLRPILGSEIDINVSLVDRIAAAGSGKHRYVVSHARADGCPTPDGGPQ